MGHASPKYTAEFKQGAAQPYRERGGTYAEIGGELGVDPGSVSDWVKRADAAGSDPSASPFQVAGENRRPKRGNERLYSSIKKSTFRSAGFRHFAGKRRRTSHPSLPISRASAPRPSSCSGR